MNTTACWAVFPPPPGEIALPAAEEQPRSRAVPESCPGAGLWHIGDVLTELLDTYRMLEGSDAVVENPPPASH